MPVPDVGVDLAEGEPGVLFGFAVADDVEGNLEVLERGVELALGAPHIADDLFAQVGGCPRLVSDVFENPLGKLV